MQNIEYLTSKDGKAIAVVIPIDIWRQILPAEDASLEDLAEGIEEYCLNKAMNEAINTPLLGRSTALALMN